MRTSFFVQAKREVPYFRETPDTPVRPKVAREKFNHVELEDGRKAQTSVVNFFPRTLPEGFFYSFFSLVDEIAVIWKTLRKNQAMALIDSSRKRKEPLYTDSKLGKLERETSSLSTIAGKVMSGADLVEFYMYMIYTGGKSGRTQGKVHRGKGHCEVLRAGGRGASLLSEGFIRPEDLP
ncbi:MAG: hypothetical protein ACP5IE_02685 [Infirmifilum sp.]|jgi:hypothetical protein